MSRHAVTNSFARLLHRELGALSGRCRSLREAFRSCLSAISRRLRLRYGGGYFGRALAERLKRIRRRLELRAPARARQDGFRDGPLLSSPDLSAFNCRVRLDAEQQGQAVANIFALDICGTIAGSEEKQNTTVEVTVEDFTDSPANPRPVRSRTRQWRAADSPEFCYRSELGRLCGLVTVVSNWTEVARIRAHWLLFARKGRRSLRFRTRILCRKSGRLLASAEFYCAYDNPELGYLDLQDNRLQARSLGVALAFGVSAADGRMYACEIELIRQWARDNVCGEGASKDAVRKIERALDQTVEFFRQGGVLENRRICSDVVRLAPPGDRHDILELCLRVAGAKGSVGEQELALLKDLGEWLEIGDELFGELVERLLPVNMHQVEDARVVLGVTPDMSGEAARKHLNRQYSKWNARVTNSDPQIQAQADMMLNLIAEARRRYVQ